MFRTTISTEIQYIRFTLACLLISEYRPFLKILFYSLNQVTKSRQVYLNSEFDLQHNPKLMDTLTTVLKYPHFATRCRHQPRLYRYSILECLYRVVSNQFSGRCLFNVCKTVSCVDQIKVMIKGLGVGAWDL